MREAMEEMIWEPLRGPGMRQPEDARCGCSHTNRCLRLCVIPSASKGIKRLTLKYLKQGPKSILKLIFINWNIMVIKKKRQKVAQEEKKH